MSDNGIDLVMGGEPPRERPGRRRAERPERRRPWWRIVVALVVLVAVVAAAIWAFGKISDHFGGPEDYTGEGSGEIVIDVPAGVGWQEVAHQLAEADVVKSAQAFYDIAVQDPEQPTLVPGSYVMREKMSAGAAYRALTTDVERAESRVVVPEGSKVSNIVKRIVEATDIAEDELLAALDDPAALGLPEIAAGNPEGYLYPATYEVAPGTTAVQLLSQMVQKSLDVTADLDIEGRAADLDLTVEQLMTVASIIEAEVRLDEDRARVARVIYNRLDVDMPLQMDSTVSYVSGREGDVWTTDDERADPSLYNTYAHPGLPPGPIGSPGEAAIEAALNPAEGDWLYFVAVDMETGETKFASSLADHEKNVAEAQKFCRESDLC